MSRHARLAALLVTLALLAAPLGPAAATTPPAPEADACPTGHLGVCWDRAGRPFLPLTGAHEGLPAASPVMEDVPCLEDLLPDRRCPAWSATYQHPGGWGQVRDAVSSPDGSTVFVTGLGWGEGTALDAVTVAFDTHTGEQRWAARYDAGQGEAGVAVAVSPDGGRVFVTGYRDGLVLGDAVWLATANTLTVAYDATSGEELWAARYQHARETGGWGRALAVAPDGDLLYVTGTSMGTDTFQDLTVVAYRTADGTQQWVTRYDGGAASVDVGDAIAIHPAGHRVYVTGIENFNPYHGAPLSPADVVTLGVEAGDPKRLGEILWTQSYGGSGVGLDLGVHISMDPDGERVYVAGSADYNPHAGYFGDMAAMAYDAESGEPGWVARLASPASNSAWTTAAALDSVGERLYLTGQTWSVGDPLHITLEVSGLTLAINTATGDPAWSALHTGHPLEWISANGVAVTPDGSGVVIVGATERDPQHLGYTACVPALSTCSDRPFGDFLTMWLDAGTGQETWRERSNGSTAGIDRDVGQAVVTDGERVVVVGTRWRQVRTDDTVNDWHAIAYQTGEEDQ